MILLFLACLIFLSLNWDTDYYQYKWRFLLMMMSIITCYEISKLSIFTALFALFLCCSSYLQRARLEHNPLTLESVLSFIGILAIIQCAMVINIFKISKLIPVLIIISSIWTLIAPKMHCKRKNDSFKIYGFGGNPSVEATLLSLLCAFSLLYPSTLTWYAIILAGIAIIRTKAAAGMAGYITMLLIYFNLWPVFPIIAGILWLMRKKEYLSPNGRIEIWKFIHQQKTQVGFNNLIGIGLGGFRVKYPFIQNKTNTTIIKIPNLYFIWCHSDLYQFYIECGLVGIIFLTFFLGEITFLNLHNPAGLAFLGCWAVNSLINFPNHLAPDSMLFALFVKNTIS
jgi:hypothetical protein